MPWSDASSICRTDWRPSRAFVAALALLGVAGAGAVLAADLPAAFAWPLALAALGRGLWLARREARRPAGTLVIDARRAGWHDGQGGVHELHDLALVFRGPCAWLEARRADGHRLRLAWWPDTLPAAARRELRLARPGGDPAAFLPLVAP